jgi:hypothetical protein
MDIGNQHLYTVADQDGAAVLDIERGLISTLNSTGAYVWQGLEDGKTLEAISAELASETGEDVRVIDGDVRALCRNSQGKPALVPLIGGCVWHAMKPLSTV